MVAKLRRVVIATDLSERSLHAARWAALHVAHDADVVLAHVIAVPALPPFIRARFAEIDHLTESAVPGAAQRLRAIASSIRATCISTEVRVGTPAEQIVDIARTVDADLIVIGRHGDRPGLAHRIGSTAERVVRISPMPVLLATSMRDTTPRHILAALDESDTAPYVVEWSRCLAAKFGANVTGLHVVHSATLKYITSHSGLGRESADRLPPATSPSAIEELVTRDGVEWVRNTLGTGWAPDKVDCQVAFGWVSHEIVATAERSNAELIVIGRSASPLGRRMFVGSVTRQVLRNALCPVLVVVDGGPTV